MEEPILLLVLGVAGKIGFDAGPTRMEGEIGSVRNAGEKVGSLSI
jgi:hypothetical protein